MADGTRSLVVRVWLPDRPGALGAVASRIGGVGGDVHEIEVVDRGAGRAVDEFLVTVPEDVTDELLAREIVDVDGVDVEELRAVASAERDPRLDALESAVALAEASPAEAMAVLADRTREELRAAWAAVVGPEGILAAAGDVPDAAWLTAFAGGAAAGGATGAEGETGVATDTDSEVAWSAVDGARLVLAGRTGVPFRPRERRVLALLARLGAR